MSSYFKNSNTVNNNYFHYIMNRANLLVEITAFIAFKRYLNSLVPPNITTKVSGITKTQSVICIINTIILKSGRNPKINDSKPISQTRMAADKT